MGIPRWLTLALLLGLAARGPGQEAAPPEPVAEVPQEAAQPAPAPLPSLPLPSDATYADFDLNCKSCHTIGGGRLTGPDLKGVLARADRAWLESFVTDPKALIDAGDPYAQEIFRAANGVVMPTQPGMTKERAARLLDLVAYESALEKSRFMGLQISDRPLTEADVARGARLFRGAEPFASGAPACFSCHTVVDAEGLGGGRLGPDLTAAFARLEGRAALAAWLSAPPSLVMQPAFRATPLEGEEILALTAYLKSASESGQESAADQRLAFLLWGLGLGAVLLVLCDLAWRGRYVATRRPLVEAGRLAVRPMVEEPVQ